MKREVCVVCAIERAERVLIGNMDFDLKNRYFYE
jgi:hypothetical protein